MKLLRDMLRTRHETEFEAR